MVAWARTCARAFCALATRAVSVSVTAFGLVLARRPISMSKLSDSAALCDICAVALVRSEDQEEIVVCAWSGPIAFATVYSQVNRGVRCVIEIGGRSASQPISIWEPEIREITAR